MNTILDLVDLNDCDEVTREMVENTRKALGLTSGEIADQLGWNQRKYQRLLDAADDEGAISRDTALAIYGLVQLTRPDAALAVDIPGTAEGGDVPAMFSELAGNDDSWRVRIAPHLMRNLILQAKQGSTTTYGAEAERLEDAGKTDRVWPRTVYGHPLGLICDVCMEVDRIKGKRVPLLSSIVVAKSGLPGPGIDGMVQKFLKVHEGADYKDSWREFKRDRSGAIAALQREVFAYPYWDDVAVRAGLA